MVYRAENVGGEKMAILLVAGAYCNARAWTESIFTTLVFSALHLKNVNGMIRKYRNNICVCLRMLFLNGFIMTFRYV